MRNPTHHVCAGSTIVPKAEQGYGLAPVRRGGAECQTGQGGQGDNIPVLGDERRAPENSSMALARERFFMLAKLTSAVSLVKRRF
jgi:hypothetical protein